MELSVESWLALAFGLCSIVTGISGIMLSYATYKAMTREFGGRGQCHHSFQRRHASLSPQFHYHQYERLHFEEQLVPRRTIELDESATIPLARWRSRVS
ncbi:hypothetical protein B0T18DRAFT_395570 [Schizothecium vesticola]|uniref:Uncharacterized protein n=1 Tax=Schizothecium vesticola TaxID=314040 RepID=A0AA40F7Y8_9PEZI|nr:hypothetical protein B0T18DRAFT_395570 [Schizothecium vesticola]